MGSKLSTIAASYSLPGFHVPPSVALALYAAVILDNGDSGELTVTVCRAENVPAVANARGLLAAIIVQPRLCTKASMLAEALRIARDPDAAAPDRALQLSPRCHDQVVLHPGVDNVTFASLEVAEAPELADLIAALDVGAESEPTAAREDERVATGSALGVLHPRTSLLPGDSIVGDEARTAIVADVLARAYPPQLRERMANAATRIVVLGVCRTFEGPMV